MGVLPVIVRVVLQIDRQLFKKKEVDPPPVEEGGGGGSTGEEGGEGGDPAVAVDEDKKVEGEKEKQEVKEKQEELPLGENSLELMARLTKHIYNHQSSENDRYWARGCGC